MLALHGWMDNAASFQALADRLDDCCMVALDLPGHGLSDNGGEWFAFIDNLVVIHQARAALGWERCVLLGHSMGGGLAALYTAAVGEHIDCLISLDAYGPISGEDLPGQLRKAVRGRDKRPARRYFDSFEAAVTARAGPHLPESCAEALATRGVHQAGDGWTWRGDRRLKWPSLGQLTEGQVRQALAAIKPPHLVQRASRSLHPDFDRLMNERQAQFPPTRLETLEAGHHLHMEQPEACALVIRQFLEQHASPPGGDKNA